MRVCDCDCVCVFAGKLCQLHLLNNLCHSFTFIGQRGGAASLCQCHYCSNCPGRGTEIQTETEAETETEATLNQWHTIKLSLNIFIDSQEPETNYGLDTATVKLKDNTDL